MKKITFFIAVALLMVSFTAKAQIVDGILYTPINRNGLGERVPLVGVMASAVIMPPSGDLVIPAQVGGQNVVAIGPAVFSKNKNITSVTIPSTVKDIMPSAFSECDKLTKVNLSEGLLRISALAFTNCDNLTEITIPNSVFAIGQTSFAGCKKLATVNMGNSVESIDAKAFLNCPIKKITLPSTLTMIGFAAFAQTDATEWFNLTADQLKPTTLTEVTAKMDNPVTDTSNGSSPDWRDFNDLAFGMTAVDTSKKLIVPAAYQHLYETNTPWSYFFASPSTDLKDTKVSNFLHFNSTNKTVTVLGAKGNMSVFDLSGKVILSQKITEDNATVSLNNLNTGIYIFKVGKNIQKLMIK